MPNPEPTAHEIQAQLVNLRNRMRAVEDIAFRPIVISIAAPGWPHPILWFRRWLSGRRDRWIERMVQRDIRRAKRELDAARAAVAANGRPHFTEWQRVSAAERRWIGLTLRGRDYCDPFNNYWRPPLRWWERLALWWRERPQRAQIRQWQRQARRLHG